MISLLRDARNIMPYNEKGSRHGYWEVYFTGGNLAYKGNYVNGKHIGYWVSYNIGETYTNRYYIQ